MRNLTAIFSFLAFFACVHTGKAQIADTVKVSRLIALSERTQDVDSALWYANEACTVAGKLGHERSLAHSLIRRGGIRSKRSEFQAAARDLLEATRIGEKLNDAYVIVKGYLSLGTNYAYSLNYPQALEYFTLGLEKARATGDKRNEATLLNNIGNIHYFSGYEKKDFGPSLKHYSEALSIYESLADTGGITMTLDNLGMAYADQQNFPAALAVLQRAYTLAQTTGDEEDIMYSQYKFSRLYAQMKDYRKAIEALNHAIALGRKLKSIDMVMNCYRHFADVCAEMHDFANAYKYQRMYSEIKDTLLNEENSKQMAEMQTKYESEKKEKQLAMLKQDNMMKEMEASRSRTFAWISVGGGIVLFIVAVLVALLLYNRYKLKKKAHEQLSLQNAVIAQKNKDITDSINYAQRLQRAVIATDAYLASHLPEHFVLYKPKDIVSGDFYWAHAPAQNEVILATADCTGHGVPGAFMSVLGASLLNSIVKERKVFHPNLALNVLRDNLVAVLNPHGSQSETRDGMDIVLCRFNFEKMVLSFSAANNPLWIVRGEELIEFKPDKFPVGIHSEVVKPFSLKNVQLQKGDIVYTLTDGYSDQFGGPSGKKFKYKELQKLLVSIKGKSMAEQRSILDDTIDRWRGNHEQVDDITVIGVKV